MSSGCMSAAIKTSSETLRGIRKIAVVPMEAPPLEVPRSIAAGPLARAGAHLLYLDPEGTIGFGTVVGVMVFGIFMLVEWPLAPPESAKVAKSVDGMLESADAWKPTVVLAEEAAARIAAAGRHEVLTVRTLTKYPGIANRGRTVFLENWMAPMRDWYNRDISPVDYRAYKGQGVDAILEVGLLNYSLYGDHLILQVMLRLVDPGTGKVLGRARQTDLVRIERPDSLFDEDGKPFKELFAELGGKLVASGLITIGLQPG